jgi:hypothetical protein
VSTPPQTPPLRNYRNKKCWKCHQYGHMRIHCPRLYSNRIKAAKKPVHLGQVYNIKSDFKNKARRSAGPLPSQGEMAKRQLLSYVRGHLIQCQSAHNYMAERFKYWAGIHQYIKDAPVNAIEGMQANMVLGED